MPSKAEQLAIIETQLKNAQSRVATLQAIGAGKRDKEYKFWLDNLTRLVSFADVIKGLSCPANHTGHIALGKCEMQSGEYHVMARCSECYRKLGQWIGKDKIPSTILDSLPVFESYLNYDLPCEVCGSPGVELHHWAPKEFFPETFEQWPKSYLCPKCHREWHNTITIPLRDRTNGRIPTTR